VAAVVVGQLEANALGAWLSLAYSLGAVLCTLAAVRMKDQS
jgi:cytochrome c biogenesis protein CcdA